MLASGIVLASGFDLAGVEVETAYREERLGVFLNTLSFSFPP